MKLHFFDAIDFLHQLLRLPSRYYPAKHPLSSFPSKNKDSETSE